MSEYLPEAPHVFTTDDVSGHVLVTPPTPATSDSKPKKSNPLIDLMETERLYVDRLTGIIRASSPADPMSHTTEVNGAPAHCSCVVSFKSSASRARYYVQEH